MDSIFQKPLAELVFFGYSGIDHRSVTPVAHPAIEQFLDGTHNLHNWRDIFCVGMISSPRRPRPPVAQDEAITEAIIKRTISWLGKIS